MKRIVLILLFSTCIFLSPLFFGKVPFPGNLLYSTYSPWKFIPDPRYPNGLPNKPMGFDNIRQIYPYWTLTREAMSKGKLPLWNPYIFSGSPHIASYDSAVFYPISLLFSILPLLTAWTIAVCLQPILAGFFMMLLLRKMKLSFLVQIFGSFIYAFSGWMIGYWEEALVLEHSVLWLPLAFYSLLVIWEDRSPVKGFVLLVGSLTFSILAGFFQIALYVLICSFFWNMYLFWKNRNIEGARKKFIIGIVAIGISLFISSIQLIPAFEAYRYSPRLGSDSRFLFEKYLLPVRHLVTFIIPDFWGNPGTYNYFSGRDGFYFEKLIFIGLLPFIFLLYTFITSIKHPYIYFWRVAAALSLSLAFALPPSWIFYILRVPVVSTAMPLRILSVFCFFACVLSAHGFQAFLKDKDNKMFKRLLTVMTIILVGIWVFLVFTYIVYISELPDSSVWFSQNSIGTCAYLIRTIMKSLNIRYSLYATIALRNTVIPSIILCIVWGIVLCKNRFRLFSLLLVFTTVFASSYYFSKKMLYFSEPVHIFPNTEILSVLKKMSGIDRVWSYGNAFIEKNFLVPYRIFSPDGYGAIFPRVYGELLSGIQDEGAISENIRRSDADLFQISEMESLGQGNPYRLRMMSLLGVRYILETKKGDEKEKKTIEDRFPESLFQLRYEDDVWRIWEYTNALPRAFFASQIEIVDSDKDLVKKLYDPSVDLRNTVYISSDQKTLPHVFTKTADAGRFPSGDKTEILQYDPEYIKLSVETKESGAVFLSDNYYPGWTAYVDGKKAEIIRANYAFRAVLVSPGTHTIVFEYKPFSFQLGVILSITGFISFGMFIFYLCRK